MMFLTLQTALLLLAAYVLGAICGCGLHRFFATPAAAGDALAAAGSAIPDQPMIEVMAGPEPSIPELSAADRFERALIGPRAPRFQKGRSQEPEAAPAIEVSTATPLTSIKASEADTASAPPTPTTTPEPEAQEQAPALTLPVASGSGGVTGTSAPLAPASQQSADDLTHIRGIDFATAAALADLGVSSYARLAAFTRADVDRIEASLGGGQRVSPENWIEQAQLLANGRATAFARQLASDADRAFPSPAEIYGDPEPADPAIPLPEPEPEPMGGEPEPVATEGDAEAVALLIETADAGAADEPAPVARVEPVEAAGAALDDSAPDVSTQDDATHDFARIRGIDAAAEALLHENGVLRFVDIANWRVDEVLRFEGLIGEPGRISRENWIEQAQVLAKGGETVFSRRRQLAPTVVPREPAPLELEPPSQATAPALAEPVEAAGAALDDAAPDVSTQDDATHDFARIRGIDAAAEALLHENRVLRFDDIANWRAPDVLRFEGLIGEPGRISRENWIEQAQVLAKGGETVFSRRRQLAPTVVPREPAPLELEPPSRVPDTSAQSDDVTDGGSNAGWPHLAGLRSVRSPLLTGGEATSGLPYDDLKRIRGIGVLIEKKLNSLGISRYSQIANWTAADVDRISQVLDFKGRIERECWIEQARILASGGHTAFSSRIDRD